MELIHVDEVIRSRRKTIAIIVKNDGRVVVRAPLFATQAQIEGFVRQKSGWIKEKQAEVHRLNAERPPEPVISYTEGQPFLYLGKSYPLKLVDRQQAQLRLDGSFLLARSAQWNAAKVFADWYRQRAGEVIGQRVTLYAARHGLTFAQIRLKDMRTRWGSCSSKGNLNFNYRLVMAPIEVVDYVVVHELAHLVQRNHSKTFWSVVEGMQPDYRTWRLWLRRNGKTIMLR